MACTIQIKTNNFLRKEGVINADMSIINKELVKNYVEQLNKLSKIKYGVGIDSENLYSISFDNKLIPNERMFDLLDESTFYFDLEKVYKNKKGLKDVLSETGESGIFEYSENEDGELEFDADAYVKKEVNLNNINERIKLTLNKINQTIRENIKRLNKIIYNPNVKDSIKTNAQQKIETLNDLMSQIEESKNGFTAGGITSFIEKAISNINFISNKIDNIDLNDSKNMQLIIKSYDEYLSSFSVIKDVESLLIEFKNNKTQKYLSKEDFNLLDSKLKQASGFFVTTNSKMLNLKKRYTKSKLTDLKYFPEIMTNHRDRLRREWEKIGRPGDRDSYVNLHLTPNGKDWDLILEDLDIAVNDLMENPMFDIPSLNTWITSPSNIHNKLFQIFNTQLLEIDNRRRDIEREEDSKLVKLFNNLKSKFGGTNNVNKLYKNIIEKDKDGRMFLKGEFKVSFLKEVTEKIRTLKKQKREAEDKALSDAIKIRNEYGLNSPQYLNAQKEVKKINEYWTAQIKEIEEDNLIKNDDGSFIPKDKWRNDLSSLSKEEKDILDYFKSVIDKGHKANHKESLRIQSYGALFYDTPYMYKTQAERIYNAELKDATKETYKYLVEKRPDDTEYTNDQVDISGERVRELKLHYRNRSGQFDHKQKSMDLATMFRMEFKNVNLYELRREKEADFSFLIDIAKHKDLYLKSGNLLQRTFGNENLHITNNLNNNLANTLKNMMDYRFYDIANKSQTKILGTSVDANKAAGYINGVAAFSALSFNFASGVANVVNANSQMFLETVFKGNKFTASNIKKANKIYFTPSVFADNLKDIINPIKTSYVNQLSEIFNTQGMFSLSDSNFLQSSLIKKGLDLRTFQAFQDSGEHWVQSVLFMSLLDNIKVMNADGKFIDENGKIVKSKKEAASLLDMHKVNKDTGLVDLDSNVVYTTHSPSLKYNEGGKELVDMLLRKKIEDTIGNYSQNQQAEGFRHYGFRMLMLFRRYLVPMAQARFMGFETALIAKDKLRKDQLRYSHALQEYEEGVYTTFIRYAFNSVKNLKRELLTRENWNSLSDYEKHNIKRTIVEMSMTFVILPGLLKLLAMGAAADDDPEEWYFTMYQVRRNITELQAYINISESYKMLKSPIPSMRMLEGMTNSIYYAFPTNWFEEDSRGNNMFLKSVNMLNPLRQFNKDFKDTFNYQNR